MGQAGLGSKQHLFGGREAPQGTLLGLPQFLFLKLYKLSKNHIILHVKDIVVCWSS